MKTGAEYQRAYRLRHPEKAKAESKAGTAKWRRDNPELHREGMRRYWLANRQKQNARNVKNRIPAGQTPSWADLEAIVAFYIACPQGFAVDHIIPLNSPYVCGLHVETNLQYLPGIENRSKGNTFNWRDFHSVYKDFP